MDRNELMKLKTNELIHLLLSALSTTRENYMEILHLELVVRVNLQYVKISEKRRDVPVMIHTKKIHISK
jgi:hypothetical protein